MPARSVVGLDYQSRLVDSSPPHPPSAGHPHAPVGLDAGLNRLASDSSFSTQSLGSPCQLAERLSPTGLDGDLSRNELSQTRPSGHRPPVPFVHRSSHQNFKPFDPSQTSPSLLASSSHHGSSTLDIQPSTALQATQRQPTRSSPDWSSESPSYFPHQSDYSREPTNLVQNCDRSREINTGLFPFDGSFSIVASSCSAPLSCHTDLRRESDPFPVAPIAQRPWEPRHRYSVPNIPNHASLDGRLEGFSYLGSPNPVSDLSPSCSGSVRHGGSFSSTASQLNSVGLTTGSTTSFGDDSCDWPGSAFPHHQATVSASLDANFGPNGASFSGPESPKDFHSGHPVPSSSFSPSGGLPFSPEVDGPSGTGVSDISVVPRRDQQVSPLYWRGGSNQQSNVPNLHPTSDKTRRASEGFVGFQPDHNFSFGFPTDPYRSISPYTSSGSQENASHIPKERLPFDFPPQESTFDSSHLAFLNSQEAQQQHQIRLRRLSIMTEPGWSRGATAMTAGRSPAIWPFSPSFAVGVSNDLAGGARWNPLDGDRRQVLRKRKNIRANYEPCQATVPEEAEMNGIPSQSENLKDLSTKSIGEGITLESRNSFTSKNNDGSFPTENENSPSYSFLRFGGIGQGKSPHPPGLESGIKPSDEDFAGVMDEAGERMVPWRQELRCEEDLYTPMWCRGQNDKKEGFCDMCEGGAWFKLKNSAFWYHKQYFHGVSSTTGHYFYPPKQVKRGFSTANRQQILGLCHECESWVGYSSTIGTQSIKKCDKAESEEDSSGPGRPSGSKDADEINSSKVPTLWYKHAHKCHRHQTCKGAKGRKKAKKS